MYSPRSLMEKDLYSICEFPQSDEELFYVSPKFQYPLTPDQIIKILENRYEPTVIVDETTDEAIAYANFYDKTEDSCWLGNVICSPQYRGSGVSSLLIETMIHKSRENLKVSKLLLSCHSTNTRGLVFYHKQGFRPVDMSVRIIGERKIVTIQMLKELM